MTPDQSFARWVHVSLVVFAILFGYFLIADMWMPVTPQSRVMHSVVRVAPQVSGQVTAVHVRDNQHVKAGDVLFTLNQAPFELAVSKAELALEEAKMQNDQMDASIAAAEAGVVAAKVDAAEMSRELKRLGHLLGRHSVSQQQYDQTRARSHAADATVQQAQAQLHQLKVQRGQSDDSNLRLRQARNALESARLNLGYTRVLADADGTLSNLQVKPGTFAQAGVSIAALVEDEADVIADFREKSLSRVTVGDSAAVVFDALPGDVFQARVEAVDAGTRQGQLAADGTLASPEATDRWVRDAQRQRLHLSLNDDAEVLERLPSGARATVQLYPADGLAGWLGALQIHAISLIHYVY
ncbi:HlyD family secretion protein [Marinobacter sp. V034]|uniref:HlyD family secretion protein n=1 Tax=Marinobacter sp. V034 TaxID=3459610 RepID=UPI0040446893